MNNKKIETFVRIPLEFCRRKDVSPSTKLVMGYILTRANIETMSWTLSAADVVNNTGLAKGTIHDVFADLQHNGIISLLNVKQLKKGQYPSKIYSINRDKLSHLSAYSPIKPFSNRSPNERLANPKAVCQMNGSRLPNERQAVRQMNLEEDKRKEEVKEEVKIEPNLFDDLDTCFNLVPNSTPSAFPKVSMLRSVLKYEPPETFDPVKLRGYDEQLRTHPPKVIQFKRSLYSSNQVERDSEAIAKASKRFPHSIIELFD